MGKYEPFARYLRGRTQAEIRLSFGEVERILGTKLPASAYQHRQWWSNNAANSAMTAIWREAGYRSEGVNLERRRVTFRRVSEGGRTAVADPVAEFRAGVAELKSLLWVDPDYDFTQPSDPGLADYVDEKYGREVQRATRG